MIPRDPCRCGDGRDGVVGIGVVSEEGGSWDGTLDLRSLPGVPTGTPNSSTGVVEGLICRSPDPFSELFGRFLPLSSVA